MSKLIIILIICNFCFLSGYGQTRGILLIKRNNGKEKVIKEGIKISIVRKDSKILIGDFHILNDSVIIVDTVKCSMNEIVQINKGSLKSEITGMIFTSINGLATYLDLTLTISESLYSFHSLTGTVLAALLVGVPATFVGAVTTTIGIVKIFRNRKYYKDYWAMKIVTENPQ